MFARLLCIRLWNQSLSTALDGDAIENNSWLINVPAKVKRFWLNLKGSFKVFWRRELIQSISWYYNLILLPVTWIACGGLLVQCCVNWQLGLIYVIFVAGFQEKPFKRCLSSIQTLWSELSRFETDSDWILFVLMTATFCNLPHDEKNLKVRTRLETLKIL